MPRLITPTLGSLDRQHPTGTASAVSLDGYTDALLTGNRGGNRQTTVRITADQHVLTVAAEYTDPAAPRSLTVLLDGPDAVVPAPIVSRANRVLLDLGVSLQRDWRSGSHGVKHGARKVEALTPGAVLTLTRAGDRWVPATATPTDPADREADPMATPTVTPSQGASSTPKSAQPEPVVAQPLPAAFSGEIVLQPDVRRVWEASLAAHRAGEHIVVGLIGPSGAGKTHAVHALSHDAGLPVVKFDASGVVEPGDWFGTVALVTDEVTGQTVTRFMPTELLDALERPGSRTLLIDEVNRANPRALNALLPVLDGSGAVVIPQTGRTAVIAADVIVAVTANIGSAFLAVEPLDEAVRTRISAWVPVEHLGEDDERGLLARRVQGLSETDAANLAALGRLVREAAASTQQHPPVSTRQLLAAAAMTVHGLPIRTAVEYAVLNGYSDEGGERSERQKVRVHVAGIDWDGRKARAAAAAGPNRWVGMALKAPHAHLAGCANCGGQQHEHSIDPDGTPGGTPGECPDATVGFPGYYGRLTKGADCRRCGTPLPQHVANGLKC